MLKILKNKIGLTPHAIHTTERKDWEEVLDQLFLQVIVPTEKGLGILTNTKRKSHTDLVGKVSTTLGVRLKKELHTDITNLIYQYKLPQFQAIMDMTEQEEHRQDFFKLVRTGLPNNTLMFPVKSSESNEKQAMLLFSPIAHRAHIQRIVEGIKLVLTSPEKKSKKETCQSKEK